MDRTLSVTNTRCRKLSTSGALSARSSRQAGLLSRSHAISSTLGTTDIVGRRADIHRATRAPDVVTRLPSAHLAR